MKKQIILIAIITTICALNLQAQRNLEFSQVIFTEFQGVYVSNYIVDQKTLIVPAGKVLKIESTSVSIHYASGRLGPVGGSLIAGIYLNDKLITNSSPASSQPIFPLWLKEGTYTLKLSSNISTNTTKGYVSGIEFNVAE